MGLFSKSKPKVQAEKKDTKKTSSKYDKDAYERGKKNAIEDHKNIQRQKSRVKNEKHAGVLKKDKEWLDNYKDTLKSNIVFHQNRRDDKTKSLKQRSNSAGYVAQAKRYKTGK